MSTQKKIIIIFIFVISTTCLFLLNLNNGFSKSKYYFSDFILTENLVERTPDPISNDVLLDGVVDKKILKDYVLILNMIIEVKDTSIIYTGEYEYWILDYLNEELIGPLSNQEFHMFLTEHDLGNINLEVTNSYKKKCTVNCDLLENISP